MNKFELGIEKNWVKYGCIAIVTILLAVFYIQTLGKAYRPHGYDMDAYVLGAKALLNGSNPYQSPEGTPFIYIYPLFLAFVFVPLLSLPAFLLHSFWFAINVAGLLGSCFFMLKATSTVTKSNTRSRVGFILLLTLLLGFSSIQNSFLNGQVNFVVLFCCVMFFYNYNSERYFSSNVWLAVAIAIKLTPAVFLGFYFFRKKFKSLGLTIVISILLMFLPIVMIGGSIFEFYETYINTFILHKFTATADIVSNFESFAPGFNLQSVIGLSYPDIFYNGYVKWISFALPCLMLLVIELKIANKNSNEKQWTSFCAYLVASVLLSPMGEKHHLVIIIPIFVVVISACAFNIAWRHRFSFIFWGSFLLVRTLSTTVLQEKIYLFFPLIWLLLLIAYFSYNRERFEHKTDCPILS